MPSRVLSADGPELRSSRGSARARCRSCHADTPPHRARNTFRADGDYGPTGTPLSPQSRLRPLGIGRFAAAASMRSPATAAFATSRSSTPMHQNAGSRDVGAPGLVLHGAEAMGAGAFAEEKFLQSHEARGPRLEATTASLSATFLRVGTSSTRFRAARKRERKAEVERPSTASDLAHALAGLRVRRRRHRLRRKRCSGRSGTVYSNRRIAVISTRAPRSSRAAGWRGGSRGSRPARALAPPRAACGRSRRARRASRSAAIARARASSTAARCGLRCRGG